MRTRFSILILLLLISAMATPVHAQDEQVTVIRAGTIITVSGDTITDGQIIIIDGVIELVGRQLEYPRNATIIDARDKVVMPGLIHAYTRHGLQNLNRNGVNGNITLDDELYWETMNLDDLLEHGITAVGMYPGGSGLPGMASSFRTGGDEAARVLDKTAYLPISMNSPGRDKNVLRGAIKKAHDELEKIKNAREEWEQKQKEAAEAKAKQEAEQQGNGDNGNGNGGGNGQTGGRQDDGGEEEKKEEDPAEFKPPQTDAAVQPLMDLISEQADFTPLISIGSASHLLHLNDVIADEKFGWNLMLSNGGSTDMHNVMDDVKDYGGLVLTTPGLSTITQTSTRYNLPAAIERTGCEVAFMPSGSSERALSTYLARVADTVRAGMSREAALKAITMNAAKVIGADEQIGSIEKGRSADLIILDGDPLNPLSRIDRVLIQGETVFEAEEDE